MFINRVKKSGTVFFDEIGLCITIAQGGNVGEECQEM